MKKKSLFLSILLAVMLTVMFPTGVFADDSGQDVENSDYTVNMECRLH